MNADQIRGQIQRLVTEALEAKGSPAKALTDDTLLLGGDLGIDSLDLAGVVVNLSEFAQRDPFANGFVEFRTVGEMIRLYASDGGAECQDSNDSPGERPTA